VTFALVEAGRDRRAIGRGVLTTLTVGLIGGGLLIAQLGRLAAPAVEPPTGSGGRHQLVIPGDAHGQCHIAARVNGVPFHGLLDSGASPHLTFGRNDAVQLGFDPAKLSYSYRYSSANGIGHYARVQVREFRLESFVLRDIPVAITDAPQSQPLIGSAVLHRLNFRLKDGNCELSWS
jgi:clan AA aspartic protease (TIGR02281 family)